MNAIDRAIDRIATDNNRVVSWKHLVDAGVSGRAVRHRVVIGRLHRIHHGVYLIEPAHIASKLALFTAAVYACAPHAFLSHRSAAELWELMPARRGPIHVTVLGRNPGTKRDGIKVHRTSTLTRNQVRNRRRVPVTSPARTIRDLAPTTGRDDLELLVATAYRKSLISEREAKALISERELRGHAPAFTRSTAECLMLRLCREAGLPTPLTNTKLGGFEVDFYWPASKLVIEIDSWEFHKDRHAFERDRARDAALTAAGYKVIRVTWRALGERPLETVARIAQALNA